MFVFWGTLCALLLLFVIKKNSMLLDIPSCLYTTRKDLRGDGYRTGTGPPPLRMLTLNLFLRFPGISHVHGDTKNQRLRVFLERILACYDVVVLQEVCGAFTLRRRKLVQSARQLGFHFHVVPKAPHLFSKKTMDSGLVVLSRYPILACGHLTFSHAAYADQWMAKGALYAKIEYARTVLHVFNVHLQSTYSLQDEQAASVQKQQIAQLKAWINQKTALSSGSVLVCGDFNLSPLHVQNAMAPMHDLSKEQEDWSIEIEYHKKSGKELSTTRNMCRRCLSSSRAQHKTSTFCRSQVDHMFLFHMRAGKHLHVSHPVKMLPDLGLSDHRALTGVFVLTQ
jgi:endonuclease/exonuclease/phosphatase family metal-dependent hydrolase